MNKKRTELNRPKFTKKYTLPFILITLAVILSLSLGTVSAADWTVGPGGTYNYTSIQDAIDNESTISGDTISVYDNGGTPYTYNENIVVNKANLTVQSTGQVTVSGSSNPANPVFTVNNQGAYANIIGFILSGATNSAGVLVTGTNNVTLTNLTINNCQQGVMMTGTNTNITVDSANINSPNAQGVYLGGYGDYNKNILIENVNITNSGATAIFKGGEAALEHITIRNTQITNPQGNGIYLTNHIYWHQLIDVIIDGVTITGAQSDGIYVNMESRDDSYDVTINNTTVNGSTGNGATILGRRNINITNNNHSFKNNTGWGLYLRGIGTTTTTFQNNNIENNGNGLYLENIHNINITNALQNNGGIGCQIVSCTNNILQDTTFTNTIKTYTHAVYVGGSSNQITLRNLNIINASSHSILIGHYASDIKNLLIENTQITNGNIGIYFQEEGAIENTTIRNTQITNPQSHGIYLYPIYWHPAINTIIDGVTINNAHADAIYINMARTDSRDITLNNSTINGTTGNGATILAKGNINITNNNHSFKNNTGWGLYLIGYNNPTLNLNNNTIENNGNGLWLQAINGGNFHDNQLINNTGDDLYATGDTSNTFTRLLVGLAHPTLMTFDYVNGIIMNGVENAPTDPAGWLNIGKYVDLMSQGSTVVNHLWVYYNPADVVGKNETGLKICHYTGGAWSELPQPNGVNTTERYVYADGINSFSTFAPLAEKLSTTLELPDVTGYRNEQKEISATLKDANGNGVANQEVKFFIDSVEVGHDTTDGSGVASILHDLTEVAGTHTLTATFAGDDTYKSSANNTATLTVNKRPTTLTVNNTSGVNGQDVILAARLTSEGIAVSGVTITFTIGGNTYTETTGTDGWANKTYTITQTPGNYNIGAEFTETDYFLGSTGTGTLTVNKKTTTLTVTDVTVQKGKNVDLTATLLDNNGQPINNKQVNFQVNGADAGNANTVNGVATVNYLANLVGGNYVIQADFTGDADYLASTGTGNLKVPQSSLYIHTTASNTNPTLGEIITITFKLGNNGPDNASNVTFILQIPEGMEFINASTDQGDYTYNDTTRTITWNLGDVKVGDPNLWAKVRVVSIGSFILRPFLSTDTYDPTLNNNIQPITINVQAASQESQAEINAQTQTIGMQTTGTPIGLLLLAVLMVLGGIITPKRKK